MKVRALVLVCSVMAVFFMGNATARKNAFDQAPYKLLGPIFNITTAGVQAKFFPDDSFAYYRGTINTGRLSYGGSQNEGLIQTIIESGDPVPDFPGFNFGGIYDLEAKSANGKKSIYAIANINNPTTFESRRIVFRVDEDNPNQFGNLQVMSMSQPGDLGYPVEFQFL